MPARDPAGRLSPIRGLSDERRRTDPTAPL
jgi:hypothetical protein